MVWLSEQQRSFYATNGYIMLESLYSRSECAQMAAAATRAESRVAAMVRKLPTHTQRFCLSEAILTMPGPVPTLDRADFAGPLPTLERADLAGLAYSVVCTWARAGEASGGNS